MKFVKCELSISACMFVCQYKSNYPKKTFIGCCLTKLNLNTYRNILTAEHE